MKNTKIMSNTIMLMIFQISKIVFPFVTLPYLTRVLTTDMYGTVSYVKTVMTYMQILVDFGFVLSATKDIVKARDDKDRIGIIIGDTLFARIVLGIVGLVVVLILSLSLPILKQHVLYTLLSYLVVFMSIFLMDFLFRGIEKMHIITLRFLLMKTISTILTFVLVKGNQHFILLPLLDIASSAVAVLLVFYEMKKLDLKIQVSNFVNVLKSIKESFIYFVSSVASTSFNALSTIIIGIYISTTEVAYWGLCMQIVGSIQACYNPIADGIYPEMVKTKNWKLIEKMLKIFIPLVIVGCVIVFVMSDFVFMVLGGPEYLAASPILRLLVPCLFFAFFSMIIGWPALGSIGKAKEATTSTLVSCIIYIVMLVGLVISNSFTLVNVAIVRVLADVILLVVRFYYCRKFKDLFNYK